MSNPKVFFLFLDGAPHDVITSLARAGILQNFQKLMNRGATGVLESTIPPLSPVAIPALMTGRNPGSSGIFGWAKFQDGVMIPHTSASIKGATIFDTLTSADKKMVVLNMPFTYPPFKINGVIISGPPVPQNQVVSYPIEAGNKLKDEIGEYFPDMRFGKNNYNGLNEDEFVEEIKFLTQNRENAMFNLMENYDWNFFMVGFTSLDRMQHVYFGYLDELSPHFDEEKRQILIEYYKEIDAILGRIIENVDDNTILIVASDHGYEFVNKRIGLYNLLEDGGFIDTKRRLFDKDKIVALFKKFGIDLTKIKDFSRTLYLKSQRVVQDKVEYSSSKVYIPYGNSIAINRKIVKDDESYQNLVNDLVNYLHSLVDDDTQEKIVEKVYHKDELYSGGYVSDAPDLLIVFKEGYETSSWSNGVQKIKLNTVGTTKTGTHIGSRARRGLCILSGTGIKHGYSFEAKIYDVSPTILNLMGVAVPENMDGIVLTNILEYDSILKKRGISYDKASDSEQDREFDMSEDDQKDILDRLKKLGYIE